MLIAGFAVVYIVEGLAQTDLLTLVLAVALGFFGLRELYDMTEHSGFNPHRTLGMTLGIILLLLVYATPHLGVHIEGTHLDSLILEIFLVAALGLLFLRTLSRSFGREALNDTAVTFLGILYIPFLLSFVIKIRSVPIDGFWLVVLLIIITEGGDIPAFVIGSKLGRRKFAPRASPGKTLEGALAHIVFGILVTVGFVRLGLLETIPAPTIYVYGIVVSLLSLPSDLSESILKRCLSFKDSGTGLRSYGGVLDRIDCLLFTAPAGYIVITVSKMLA
jgi:phosphatidate cytidylyltransferase